MLKIVRLCLMLLLSLSLLPGLLVAQCTSSCTFGVNAGAQYVICVPTPSGCYNGNVVMYAHGYVPVGAPPDTWQSQLFLPDGTYLPTLVNNLGFGFAASGYSKDGLAILQGIQDTLDLIPLYKKNYPANRLFITGASEGGLVATKSVESFPGTYSGGLAVSGPIGDFRKQINYFGDVRVLFDYFFPGILVTGTSGESAINIAPALMLNWSSVYEPKVRKAIRANFWATFQLISTAKIPIGLNFNNAEDAIVDALWYNVFATDDARATLAGNPYDNIGKVYNGSFNDGKLNGSVARFAADPTALANLVSYETTGLLGVPLVTLHNTADPVTPFWHETLYAAKARATGSSSELAEIPVLRFGHVQVTAKEVTSAFLLMLLKAGLQ
ncbi:MAG TPA: hypothetical protein VMW38_22055 [Terriglobia bacterium]|nr:hypothetical protein [Terriglobia bacterium]